MKLRISALIYVALAMSCAGKTARPTVTVSENLNLRQLSSNTAFVQDQSGHFETVLEATEKIRIYTHQFPNQSELQGYLLNRRMLLHKGFQDQIAPYFGLIQLNKVCLSKVDTKGEPQAQGKNEEFLKMKFPANDSTTLSDCSTDTLWGSIEYHFHNCKDTNTLFEIRVSRKEGQAPATLRPVCN